MTYYRKMRGVLMNVLAEHLGFIASLIGSLTVVGSALIWIYNKFISHPREKKRLREEEKRQDMLLELITRENRPMNTAIQQLTKLLDESSQDRMKLNDLTGRNTKLLHEHDDTLTEHNNRLIVLETKNGISEYRYKERGE